MKKFLFIVFAVWMVQANGQNRIGGYEYWFDGQYAGRQMVAVPPVSVLDLQTQISTSALSEELHVLNIRFLDDSSRWSSVLSRFFYRQPASVVPGSTLIAAYQYWFDGHFEAATFVPLSPGPQVHLSEMLPATSLGKGLHLLHTRFRDTRGLWSSVVSQFVYVGPTAGPVSGNAITKMYYWTDRDHANMQSRVVASGPVLQVMEMLDVSTLPDGLHQVHIQFRDTFGVSSSTISQFFYKSPATGITNNVITGYRYWFNNDDGSKMVVHETEPQTVVEVQTQIDMGCLTGGDNRLHMQFRDARGLWSSAVTDTVGVTIPELNIYRFVGTGNWSNEANWQHGRKPATDLPGCKEIIIDHAPGGVCILDVQQNLLKNSKLTVLPGKQFVIPKEIILK
ncbi:MAG TPA: hypothetical protein VK907_01375 [Phnomibacter sp.]|nr:hypothetical protein [Phnomibacter sp.]